MKRTLVVLAVIAGCHKDSPATSSSGWVASTFEQDALWAKAPAGAVAGVVASSRAVGMIEHGWRDLHGFMKSFPAFAPMEAEMEAGLAEIGLTGDFSLADLGLTADKGFAAFIVGEGKADVVLLVPVADRDKFVKISKGTRGTFDTIGKLSCKAVDGGLYGCATDRALLDTLGKGDLRGKLDAAKARGDIEGVVTKPVALAAVVQLDRGALVARGVFGSMPKEIASKLGSPVKPQVDLDHSAGFATLNLAPLVAELPPVPIIEGVTAADLAHSIGGPLNVSVAVGDMMLDAHVPLNDTAPAQKVIEHCAEVPPLQMLGATYADGVCHVPVPQYNLTIDLWIEGKELHFGKKGATPAKASAPASPIGIELAKGQWQMAFWGHGTVLGQGQPFPAVPGALPDMAAMVVRGMMMLNEIGLGVTVENDSIRFVFTLRTAWSNPDDVVAKLTAIPAEDILAGKGAERGKAIADAAPKSPFAADYQGGASGLMIPTAFVGVMAAVAIPAFLQYQKKSRVSEPDLQLNRLGKALKAYYAANGGFPVGDAKALPDFPTCCGLSSTGQGIDGKCPSDPAAWAKDKIWSALDFAITEPTTYRYTYHSDGKTVTAQAIGDADCDGQFATHELHVEVQNGNPELTLTKPPAGVY
jgi:hypothetical protein